MITSLANKIKLAVAFFGACFLAIFWFINGRLKRENETLNREKEDLEADKKIRDEYDQINKNIANSGFFKLDDELFKDKTKNS